MPHKLLFLQLSVLFLSPIKGSQAELYQWSCSPLVNNRYFLPNLGLGNHSLSEESSESVAQSDINSAIIFPVPPMLNCSGTVSEIEYCYNAIGFPTGLVVFTLSILEKKNEETFLVTNTVSIQSSNNCPTTGGFSQFQFCCGTLTLHSSDQFHLPTENFAFGIVTLSSSRTLAAFPSTVSPQYLVEHYTVSVTEVPVMGDTLRVGSTETNKTLRLLQFSMISPTSFTNSPEPATTDSYTNPVPTHPSNTTSTAAIHMETEPHSDAGQMTHAALPALTEKGIQTQELNTPSTISSSATVGTKLSAGMIAGVSIGGSVLILLTLFLLVLVVCLAVKLKMHSKVSVQPKVDAVEFRTDTELLYYQYDGDCEHGCPLQEQYPISDIPFQPSKGETAVSGNPAYGDDTDGVAASSNPAHRVSNDGVAVSTNPAHGVSTDGAVSTNPAYGVSTDGVAVSTNLAYGVSTYGIAVSTNPAYGVSTDGVAVSTNPAYGVGTDGVAVSTNPAYGVSTDGVAVSTNPAYGVSTDGVAVSTNPAHGVGNDGVAVSTNPAYGVGTDGVAGTTEPAYGVDVSVEYYDYIAM